MDIAIVYFRNREGTWEETVYGVRSIEERIYGGSRSGLNAAPSGPRATTG